MLSGVLIQWEINKKSTPPVTCDTPHLYISQDEKDDGGDSDHDILSEGEDERGGGGGGNGGEEGTSHQDSWEWGSP